MCRGLHCFVLLFLPVLVFAACGKSKETCERESADLAAMFKSMDTRRGLETRAVKLVRRDELPIAADQLGTVLEVSAEGVTAWGISETPAQIEVVLDLLLQNWRGEKSPPVLLAIDARTPWSKVTEVFSALSARGFKEIGIVFARKAVPSTPPPRSSIDDKLDEAEKAEPADRATRVAQLASELVRDCEAINTLFAGVGGGEDKAKYMIEGLPPALVACRCKCDVPALKSLMYRLLVNRAPTTTIHVRLDGAELAFAGSALWSEAGLKLSEGQSFKAISQAH